MNTFLSIVQILIFTGLVGTAFYFGFKKFKEIYSNIMLGKPETINTTLGFRLKSMFLIAFGQKKMFKLTFAALLHLVIYVSFCITQIELIEIFLDGFTAGHRRIFHLAEGTFFQSIYVFAISFIEFLTLLIVSTNQN